MVPQRTCVRDWVLSQQLGDCGRVGHITCLLLIALSLFLLLPFESPAGHRQELAAKKTLCYAFLRHGDIWTVCEGKREQIHIGRDLLDFAISSDGTFLAYLIDTPELRRKGLFRYLDVVSLSPGFKTTEKQVELRSLSATCGTILGLQVGIGKHPPTDVLLWKPLEFPPNLAFRCSSDRRVIAGLAEWNASGRSELVVMITEREQWRVPVYLLSPEDFDVSSTGKYIAYFKAQEDQVYLCVAEPAGPVSCSLAAPGGANQVFVSDSGAVLYTTDLNQDCGGGPCSGVAYWRPGSAKPEIIEKNDSYSPQWITPQVAATLHRWNSRRAAGHCRE